jgi:hypothetical protein
VSIELLHDRKNNVYSKHFEKKNSAISCGCFNFSLNERPSDKDMVDSCQHGDSVAVGKSWLFGNGLTSLPSIVSNRVERKSPPESLNRFASNMAL